MLSATDPQHTSNSSNSLQPRHYLLFVVFIAIIGAFSSLVNDMYLPTIPAMRREFHTTPSMTQMGLSLAMLGMGLGSIVWGSLSDHFGRKRILIISLAIFVVATGVSLLSSTIEFFISMRLLQGIGAGGAWCSQPPFRPTYTAVVSWASS